jgi:hypothetical protein
LSKKRPILLRTFRIWQRRPHQVRPITADIHQCCSCGTSYQGNYCPRCGQSASIGRFSFKNAFLLFLDVWGIGNRSMFRTIRDLILRPGHMIHDYLHGMQSAYFPPFKMFFLLIALSLLVDTGLNIQGINREKHNEKETTELVKGFVNSEEITKEQEKQGEEKTAKALTEDQSEKSGEKKYRKVTDTIFEYMDQHGSVVVLVGLLIFSLPLYLLFRHCPSIPDLRLSECFVAMVYITNMIIIYNIIPSLLCFNVKAEIAFNMLSLLLVVIPIKQLSGYSYWSTIWRILVAIIPFVIISLMLLVAIVVGMYYYYES